MVSSGVEYKMLYMYAIQRLLLPVNTIFVVVADLDTALVPHLAWQLQDIQPHY
jgi:hypothetical protein